jgi:hypothetical protein
MSSAQVSKTVALLGLFVLVALPWQYPVDVAFSYPAILSIGKIQLKAGLLHAKHRFALASVDHSLGRAAAMNLNFLRTDYKQNLLVWPIVAGNLTRSPPAGNLR